MKVRVLYKDSRYYIQEYVYVMCDPMIGGYYEWRFVKDGLFSKKWFALAIHAKEYAQTILDGNEGYALIEEMEK